MKLTDLNPKWLADGKMMVFDCPHCQKIKVSVIFAPMGMGMGTQCDILEEALGDDTPFIPCNPESRWNMSNNDFETMSITPSLNAQPAGHWHGHITNGQVITV